MIRLRAPLYLSVAALLVACSPSHSQNANKFSSDAFNTGQPRQVPSSALGMKASFAPVVKAVAPAVVNVYAKSVVRQQVDPFWQMFSGMQPQARAQESLGSGVIVRKDGIIVTNNHVIAGGTSFMVVLNDRRQFPAKVLLADPRTDLAILQIDTKGENLPTIALDNDRDLEVGDLVLAIGNPFGVGQTVTNGIISALDRTDVGQGDGSYIQTDAAINPGNSGGALVDMNGRLIGINSMILSGAGQSSGVGFAIPAPLVKRVIDSAVGGATHLSHPWLGLKGNTITGDIASSLGMDRPEGVLVSDVYPGGPADKAGLKTGDVIISLDGQAVNDEASLKYRINLMSPGDTVEVKGLRSGKPIDVHLKAEVPSGNPPRDEIVLKGENPFAGAHVVNLSPAVADDLGIDPFDAPKGVMISQVDGGYAANVGLRPGDIIRSINGKTINTTADVQAATQGRAHRWQVTIQRGDQTITASFG
ncbi:Do family serine endopeptidase [Asticcacaulis sp. EMRT-3]|uniref:Do family serine endopeptidase n=1 Tax=Asticcacaulis sp. EMRT-3 TaxID=3040349 RepID=UPI0024AECEF4|nr:Do family serine endopeptidase [Asticcacaulis sp. EMRT-3]MDI7775118.1 Do family serine endopeptidase [Asticcacaulis sp. EMRT-3]